MSRLPPMVFRPDRGSLQQRAALALISEKSIERRISSTVVMTLRAGLLDVANIGFLSSAMNDRLQFGGVVRSFGRPLRPDETEQLLGYPRFAQECGPLPMAKTPGGAQP